MNDYTLPCVIKPLHRAMNYLIAGFILSSFYIHYSFLPQLMSMISTLCFYFGLRMIKKETRYFYVSYIISIILLLTSSLNFIIIATPFHLPKCINHIFIVLRIIFIILTYINITHFSHHKNTNIYIIILSTIMTSLVISPITLETKLALYLILWVLLISFLVKMKKDIINNNYDVQLFPVRINAWKMTLIIITSLMTCIFLVMYEVPLRMYHYTDKTQNDYTYLHLLDQKNMNIYQPYQNGVGSIYDYDDQFYLYVYEIQLDLDRKYSSIDVEYGYGLSLPIRSRNEIVSFVISEGSHTYQYKTKESLSQYFIDVGYSVPINPEATSLSIQLAVKIDKLKAYDEEYRNGIAESIINIYGTQYMQYPYPSQYKINSIHMPSTGYKWGFS